MFINSYNNKKMTSLVASRPNARRSILKISIKTFTNSDLSAFDETWTSKSRENDRLCGHYCFSGWLLVSVKCYCVFSSNSGLPSGLPLNIPSVFRVRKYTNQWRSNKSKGVFFWGSQIILGIAVACCYFGLSKKTFILEYELQLVSRNVHVILFLIIFISSIC